MLPRCCAEFKIQRSFSRRGKLSIWNRSCSTKWSMHFRKSFVKRTISTFYVLANDSINERLSEIKIKRGTRSIAITFLHVSSRSRSLEGDRRSVARRFSRELVTPQAAANILGLFLSSGSQRKRPKAFDEAMTMMKPSPTSLIAPAAFQFLFPHHNFTSVNWHSWSTYFVVIWHHYVYILSQVVGSPSRPRHAEHLQQKEESRYH